MRLHVCVAFVLNILQSRKREICPLLLLNCALVKFQLNNLNEDVYVESYNVYVLGSSDSKPLDAMKTPIVAMLMLKNEWSYKANEKLLF